MSTARVANAARPSPPRASSRPRARRVPWALVLPIVAVLALIAAWSGFWYHMALKAERTVTAWREREAKLGRIYNCASESFSGYPFRIEVRCTEPWAELRNVEPNLAIAAKDVVVAARITDATHLMSEFQGPLTMGELGHAPSMIASWTHAETTVEGSPYAPERGSVVLQTPSLDRMTRSGKETVIRAERLELRGQIIGGTARERPIIEVVLRLADAQMPNWHPLAAQSSDVELRAILRGLPDFTPKSWPQRFKELQQAGGRIDITSARLQQGDTIGVTSGTLSLNAHGGLEGLLRITIVGLDRILPALGIDRLPPTTAERLAPALSALDRFAPGLGASLRGAPNIAAGIAAIGEKTELEGKPAITLPLRFADGAISLGPLNIGRVPPLF